MSARTDNATAPNPAEVYEQHMVPSLFVPWSEDLLRRVTPKPGDRVLDIACGTGAVLRQIAPLVGDSGALAGADVSPAMLEVCQDALQHISGQLDLAQASAESLPFDDDTFDLAVCQQGLQFFPDRPGALSEMNRVLRPGGRVGIAVWQPIEKQPLFNAFDLAFESYFGARQLGVAYSLGDPEELGQLMKNAGFSDVAVEGVTRDISFPDADSFVRLTILATVAVIPEYAEMEDSTAQELVASIAATMEPTLERYRDGQGIRFPMLANIAIGHA